MNNIENAIRHLQSSIDIRSNRLTIMHGLVIEYAADYKNALQAGNISICDAKDYKQPDFVPHKEPQITTQQTQESYCPQPDHLPHPSY